MIISGIAFQWVNHKKIFDFENKKKEKEIPENDERLLGVVMGKELIEVGIGGNGYKGRVMELVLLV